jgi:hypothetical protein
MADMSKYPECASWLRETIAACKYPSSALRRVERAAVEQRANFESCRFSGRWRAEAEYRRCVELLERALPKLRKKAEAEARADAAAKVEAERREAEHLAEIRRKFAGRVSPWGR